MPSTPSLLDFAGLAPPRRPAQAQSGRARPAGWRSRGGAFYCVGTIAFAHALVDFEAVSVAYFGQRYLLGTTDFLIFVRLLFAEGAEVEMASLAEAASLTPVAVCTATVVRHLQRLGTRLDLHGQGGMLRRRRGRCALAYA